MLIEGTGLRKLRALVRFEWDSRKAASFEEAVSVFLGPLAKIFDDEDRHERKDYGEGVRA